MQRREKLSCSITGGEFPVEYSALRILNACGLSFDVCDCIKKCVGSLNTLYIPEPR